MPHKAVATKKKSSRSKSTPAHVPINEPSDIAPKKISKPLEIDEPELLIGHEEKVLVDDETSEESKEDDAIEDAVGLDDEEINPFGDKWEQ